MVSSPAMSPSSAWSAASYAFFMLVIGVPMWLKTTEVYRVSLPYDAIDALSVSSDVARISVNVQLVTVDTHKDHQLGPKVQQQLLQKPSSVFSFSLSGRAPTMAENKAVKESRSLEQLDDELRGLHDTLMPGSVLLFEIPEGRFSDAGSANIMLGRHRLIFFTRSADLGDLIHILREAVLGETAVENVVAAAKKSSPDVKAAELRRVTAAAGYDILFSLLVPEPDTVMAKWNIGRAIDDAVLPFLDSLGANYSTFNVKSQQIFLTKLNLKPKKQGDANVVSEKDLGLAINPVENRLASHVSSNPRLNFLVYVPTAEQSPLHIVDHRGEKISANSFLIPRWGGVAIYNAEPTGDGATIDIDTEKTMGIFLTQLRLLLGLQNLDAASLPAKVMLLPLKGSLRTWERDLLYRLRTLENLELTRITLQSLAHLLSQISNIVINDEIGEHVVRAVDGVAVASAHAAIGRLEAYEQSTAAFAASEKAFFDPSLLALLYFPEDQKYAIYIPLFLPVGIPVAMSLQQMYKFFRSKAKTE